VAGCFRWPHDEESPEGLQSHSASAVQLCGLVPRVRESAGQRVRGGITRQGSPWLRWIMVEAAQVATRCSPAAKVYYQRLRRKKPGHVARVALARKLLVAVWAMLHDGVAFDESVFCGGVRGIRRCHPCSSRTTIRWSGGDRTYLMCREHE
jgi:hypothetical protein